MSVGIANQQDDNTSFRHTVDCTVLEQDTFQRVIEDVTVAFGDGGEADLSYPVLVCPSLPVGVDDVSRVAFLQELNSEMDRLAKMRGDIQQNGVVEDIVDPELFPRIILAKHERQRAPLSSPADTTKAALINSDDRGSYTWIPTTVAYNADAKEASLMGPIQNLPRTTSNERIYTLLERCLSEVMPSLLRLGVSEEATEVDSVQEHYYKVSIKLQRYRLPPHSNYKGMWHTEGVTEGITAAAVLYVDWQEELQGGALKFRPASTPSDWFSDSMRTPSGQAEEIPEYPKLSLSVPGKRGSSVAFSNTIPHRFETLRNETDKFITRSFVNFFLASPFLPDTTQVPTNADIYLALVGRTNYDIVHEVLEWLGNTPTTVQEAKALRARSKAEMVDKRSKWGSIHYGNCGNLEFLPTGGPTPQELKQFDELTKKRREADNWHLHPTPDELKTQGVHHNYDAVLWTDFGIDAHRNSSSSGSDGTSLLTAGK